MYRVLILLLAFTGTPAHAAESDDVQVRIFAYFLKRAGEGDMNSQYIVGSRYETGKGTAQDLVKAREWYQKAAQQGHPIAKQKLEEQGTTTVKPVAAKDKPAQATAAIRHSEPVKKSPPSTRSLSTPTPRVPTARAFITPPPEPPTKAPEPLVMVKAPNDPPAEKPLDTLSLVLNSAWRHDVQPAEFLPSTKTSCLQADSAEIVCFSEEMRRNVGGAVLTYSVKSTLTNFSKDGTFNVQYLYNVVNIDRAKNPAPLRDEDKFVTPQARTGWQEPGTTLDCKANKDEIVTCTKDKKYAWRFTK